jgi:hypothetical protein
MMKAFERLTQGLGLLCALGVLVCAFFFSRLPERLGLDVWNVGQLLRELKAQERLGKQLEAEDKVILDDYAAKRQIAREVASGGLTLLEAAAQFRHLNETRPDFNWSRFRLANPGNSDVESHCRQVLAFVDDSLLEDRDPSRAATVGARLEAELRAYLDGERKGGERTDSQGGQVRGAR